MTTTSGGTAPADTAIPARGPAADANVASPTQAPRQHTGPRHAAGSADLSPPAATGRAATLLRQCMPAVAAYAGARLVGLVVLAVFAHRAGRPLFSLLTGWDTTWYVNVAEHGYDTSIRYVGDQLVHTNIAFFPLFPWLIRAASGVGVSPWWAAVIIANLAGLAAAWGIAMIGATLYDRRVGLILAVLWGALPHAVVQSMGYTESLFTALCAWALWAVLDRRWLLAGGLTVAAGLTRPTVVALIAAVGVASVIAIVRHRGRLRDGGWRPWAAALLAPAGFAGYLIWCAAAVGRLDAYFWMQDEGWATDVDFGATTLHELGVTATHERQLAMYVAYLVLVLAVLLLALLFFDRTAERRASVLPLLIFAGLLVFTVLVQGGIYPYAKARLLLPAFPLLIPLATGLAAARTHVRWAVLGLLVAVSAWYGTYLTITWHLSP